MSALKLVISCWLLVIGKKQNTQTATTYNLKPTTQSGFTLIELMVAISIVAILSTIGMVMYGSAQGTARDSKRKQTLTELATALETYKTANGSYPVTSGYYSSEPGDATGNNGGNWIPGLAPNYIKQLPRDPKGGQGSNSLNPGCPSWKQAYLYQSSGQEYKLLSHCSMETASGWNSSDPLYDKVRPTWAWQVCQGVAACDTW